MAKKTATKKASAKTKTASKKQKPTLATFTEKDLKTLEQKNVKADVERKVVVARVSLETADALSKKAKNEATSVSNLLNEAISSFLK